MSKSAIDVEDYLTILAMDGEYARARAILRAAIPLAGARWRVGLEAGAGTSWGDLPLQRHFVIGGVRTLRGYETSVGVGSSMVRGRLELARVYAATTASVFSDIGWAGDCGIFSDAPRGDLFDRPTSRCFDSDDLRTSVGIGGSVLDGLIRMDLSRGLRDPGARWRLDLYLDAIL